MDILRSKQKEEISELAWIGLDDDSAQIILRGSAENIKKAGQIVRNFIKNNYIEEVQISAEDEPTLLTGGSDSAINKLAKEFGVDLSLNRSKLVVQAKGEKDKVQPAVKRLNQFLHGGDGYTVSRIAVTEQALGVVIGKNGSKRAELEKKHEGVNLFIHRSNRITIRGPEAAVEECRVDILRLVSSVRIQQIMSITPEQHEALTKDDKVKRATYGIPVSVTLTEGTLKLRGIFADVRDAQALLKEQMTGIYEARVELDAAQLTCVRGAIRDPSHFARMEESTGAKVSLDGNCSAIVVTGKRSQVRKAKSLVVGFLDFLLPDDFERLKISKPLHATVGEASVLADTAAVSGATVILDRDLSSIQVQSSDSEKIKKAVAILKEKIKDAEKLAFVINFDQSESWLIPLIIGKGGNRVNGLRLETGCQIEVNKAERTVTVTGEDEVTVAKAREALDQMIDTARKQCCFIELPADAIAAFLGRQGAHVKTFATEHKVEVERMRKDPCKVKVTGEEDAVISAKKALTGWIEAWEEKQAGSSMSIEKSSIPAVLGRGGAVISALQKEFGCKVDINREELTLTVNGSNSEQREAALTKIREIIERDKANQEEKRKARNDNFDYENGDHQPSQPKQTQAKPNNNNSNSNSNSVGLLDGRKNRSGEFAARPVGLTVEAEVPSKSKRRRNRRKGNAANTNNKDISDDSTLQVGSAAGRNLFNLLVSESSPAANRNEPPVSTNNKVMAADEQWDSSTVSSAAIGSDPEEESALGGGIVVRGANKSYIKSASGFTVRV